MYCIISQLSSACFATLTVVSFVKTENLKLVYFAYFHSCESCLKLSADIDLTSKPCNYTMNTHRKAHAWSSCAHINIVNMQGPHNLYLAHVCKRKRVYKKYSHGTGEFTLKLNVPGKFHSVKSQLPLKLFLPVSFLLMQPLCKILTNNCQSSYPSYAEFLWQINITVV